ncbi:MAG: patatin-like phospholipase family protein [Candidatus Thiodiazotropha sp. (ex Lucinoma kastoroae)]|nr:patatin-like phospholipase family protein [Candidatus Thiodiazotropha sp. (ex Lucinoma kastoroae)]
MTIRIDGEVRRIGLALSGGGFRAAAFHLGVFRKLKKLRLLDKIDLLTCVSGGSIAGGYLALNWQDPEVLDNLHNYLNKRSIAVSSVLGGMFDPFESRLDKLAKSYDQHLFDKARLEALAGGPRIYFNSTNLSTGNMFFFVAGGDGASEMGEWELGQQPASNVRISRAVAASSAFPPVFPPLKLDQEDFDSGEVEYVTLTDGGVYDNLGVNPLLRDRNQLDYAIVSDAGKPFTIDEKPTDKGSMVLVESIGILMEQVRGLQFSRLQLQHAAKAGPKPLWFSIDSDIGQQQDGDAIFASSISTNLKKLKSQELDVLGRHAGALLEHRVNMYAPELIQDA